MSLGELSLPLTNCSTGRAGLAAHLDSTAELTLVQGGGAGEPIPRARSQESWPHLLSALPYPSLCVAGQKAGLRVMKGSEMALTFSGSQIQGEWALHLTWAAQ